MSQYEFNDQQNGTIMRLASAMMGVAALELVVGVLFAGLAILSGVTGSITSAMIFGGAAVVTFIISIALKTAAGAMRAVVGTTGTDITHMMAGLGQLRRYFNVQRIVLLLFVLLFVVALVLAIWFVI